MLEAAMRNCAGAGDWAAPGVPRQLMPELLPHCPAVSEAAKEAETGWAAWGLNKRACLVCGASPPEVRTMRCAGSGCSCPARYCSVAHQKEAWKHLGHDSSCGRDLPSPDFIRTALPAALVGTLKEFGGLNARIAASCLARCSQLLDGNAAGHAAHNHSLPPPAHVIPCLPCAGRLFIGQPTATSLAYPSQVARSSTSCWPSRAPRRPSPACSPCTRLTTPTSASAAHGCCGQWRRRRNCSR